MERSVPFSVGFCRCLVKCQPRAPPIPPPRHTPMRTATTATAANCFFDVLSFTKVSILYMVMVIVLHGVEKKAKFLS